MSYQIHELKNGIRIVHRQQRGGVAHLGVIINAGSRDEQEDQQGLAHFIEHLIFKGTLKRSNYQVLSRLENVGADLNAFTTKEDTSVYASIQGRYYNRAAELLADIVFHSVFPEKEIEKEKAVIMDEISSYKDNPADWIHDEFDEIIFKNHRRYFFFLTDCQDAVFYVGFSIFFCICKRIWMFSDLKMLIL